MDIAFGFGHYLFFLAVHTIIVPVGFALENTLLIRLLRSLLRFFCRLLTCYQKIDENGKEIEPEREYKGTGIR